MTTKQTKDQSTLDVEAEPQETAIAVRPSQQPLAPMPEKPLVTAAQAKIEAVAQLTFKAYERAGQITMTDHEIKQLQADFHDDAFQPGAAGKEHLIYIEHASLRERFNSVLGMGQWALIQRSRWNESYRTEKGSPAERVYVEAMLVIRGAFAAEAIGDMSYFPNNPAQNYGDAVEGAKSAAFRRCAKELGVGLQAWKKDWCAGWWARRNNRKTPTTAEMRAKPEPKPEPAPTPKEEPKHATEATRAWFINQIGDKWETATQFCIDLGWLLPTETLKELPLTCLPISKAQFTAYMAALDEWSRTGVVTKPYEAASVQVAESEPESPEGNRVTGVIETVSTKGGQSAKGPWTRYGIKIGADWFSTFSESLGKAAQEKQGKSVTLVYEETEKGKNALEII